MHELVDLTKKSKKSYFIFKVDFEKCVQVTNVIKDLFIKGRIYKFFPQGQNNIPRKEVR